jgi:hypothetical protein
MDDPRSQYHPSGQDDFLPTHFASESTYASEHDLSTLGKPKPDSGAPEKIATSKPYSDE